MRAAFRRVVITHAAAAILDIPVLPLRTNLSFIVITARAAFVYGRTFVRTVLRRMVVTNIPSSILHIAVLTFGTDFIQVFIVIAAGAAFRRRGSFMRTFFGRMVIAHAAAAVLHVAVLAFGADFFSIVVTTGTAFLHRCAFIWTFFGRMVVTNIASPVLHLTVLTFGTGFFARVIALCFGITLVFTPIPLFGIVNTIRSIIIGLAIFTLCLKTDTGRITRGFSTLMFVTFNISGLFATVFRRIRTRGFGTILALAFGTVIIFSISDASFMLAHIARVNRRIG